MMNITLHDQVSFVLDVDYRTSLLIEVGWFLFSKFVKLQVCMLPKCYKSSTDFRTVFVFALEPFLPMWVLFLFQRELQWENGQKNVTAIKSSKSVLQLLQPSSLSLLSYFFIVLFRDTPLAPIGRTLADGQIWPKWPFMAIWPLQKQNQFWNLWTNCEILRSCTFANFEFHQNKNPPIIEATLNIFDRILGKTVLFVDFITNFKV